MLVLHTELTLGFHKAPQILSPLYPWHIQVTSCSRTVEPQQLRGTKTARLSSDSNH